MDDQFSRRPHLRLLPPPETPEPIAEADALPDVSEPASVLRRRYTVTVQADGSELIDDVEEWTE